MLLERSARLVSSAIQAPTILRTTRPPLPTEARSYASRAASSGKMPAPGFNSARNRHGSGVELQRCLAAIANAYLPAGAAALYPVLSRLGRLGLTVVLFLIGTGLSKVTIRRVGIRPFVQGVCLWAIVAAASLIAILVGWITL